MNHPVLSNRDKTHGVIAVPGLDPGIVPAMTSGMAQCQIIGMAGTSPAMTSEAIP